MAELNKRTHTQSSSHKTAYLGLMTALAIIFGYVEALIPFNIAIPGVKLGLSNLVVVFILYRYSWKEAIPVSALRVLVIGFLFGNLFSIAYGMTGAMLSLFAMTLLKRTGLFRTVGISAAGGAVHNIGQILVAYAVTPAMALFWYLPVLMIIGTLTGALIGFVIGLVRQRVREDAGTW